MHAGLTASPVTDVHVFGRRGPAQAKFTPLELRELDHSPTVEVIVDPEDIEFDEASIAATRSSKQIDMVVKTLQDWAIRDVGNRPRRLHLHFFHTPVEILGADGAVTGLRTERTELTGDGTVCGTGVFQDWDVQAVYRAVGYLSSHLADLPLDHVTGTIPHNEGRILDLDGDLVLGAYVSGWIKRGPIGLIGHTKGCSSETVAALLADAPSLSPAARPEPDAVVTYLNERGIEFTTWQGWRNLDAYERALGEPHGRERIKVVSRSEMLAASQSGFAVPLGQ
ncbi:ferredoxin-NADP+ reductase [Kutzneria sp. 744]|nr:ferredoxin-NADP+ reductase [Kutzneria sp. 744]